MATHHKGFTLIEILTVTTIIVVLGLAILVGINPLAQIFKGYDARRKADLQKIKIALEAYYSDHDCFPIFPTQDTEGRPSYVCDSDFLNPYLSVMPCDPNTKLPYTIFLTPATSSCPQQYAIYAETSSFSDSQANKIAECPKTIAVSSPDMRNIDLIWGCSFQEICYYHYGCINQACVLVSEDRRSDCKYDYCESDCNNKCSIAKFSCH